MILKNKRINIFRDTKNNFEEFNLTNRFYVGNYVRNDSVVVVSVSGEVSVSDTGSTMGSLPWIAEQNKYLLVLFFDVFTPEEGISHFQKIAYLNYNTLTSEIQRYILESGDYYILPDGMRWYILPSSGTTEYGFKNIWRLAQNDNNITVGFENWLALTGNMQLRNKFQDTLSADYFNMIQTDTMLSSTSTPKELPYNGVTLVQFTQQEDAVEPADEVSVIYSMPFSKLRHIPIFTLPTTINNLEQVLSGTNSLQSPVYVELFANVPPTSGQVIQNGFFSLDGVPYRCYIDNDRYHPYENIPHITYDDNYQYFEDGNRWEAEHTTAIDLSATEFVIENLSGYLPGQLSSEAAGMIVRHEFDNEEVGKILSSYSSDRSIIHIFQYTGHSGFGIFRNFL